MHTETCIRCKTHLVEYLAKEYPDRRWDYHPTDDGTFQPICYRCLDSMPLHYNHDTRRQTEDEWADHEYKYAKENAHAYSS